MTNPDQIIIPAGAMINFGNFEDDDPFIALNNIIAYPIGPPADGGIQVRIPSLDPDRIYFIHQPELKEA